MKKYAFPLLLFLFAAASRSLAQEVQINESPETGQLFESWVRNNRAVPEVSGWRVQLMSTTD
ncbi:MAG TPA: hypothetical protein PLW66_01840, partial [Saprospiraceae bacterium]|nr:hypothetical protein [Saprospiraceae bacterium]